MTWQGQVKLWLLVVLTIPSSIFSILIFIYFYRQRKNLSIHHHLTLILTALNFVQVVTDFPFVIIYYIRGEVFSPTNAFCLWWTWWDYSLSCVLVFIMAWGCVERHFLIFYSSAFATPRKRFLFHTVPMFLACIYPLIFYLMTIALNTCENQWDFDRVSAASVRSEASRQKNRRSSKCRSRELWVDRPDDWATHHSFSFCLPSCCAFSHVTYRTNRHCPHSIS